MTFTITLAGFLHVLGSLLLGAGAFTLFAVGFLGGMDAEGRGGALIMLPCWAGALVLAAGAVGVWWL